MNNFNLSDKKLKEIYGGSHNRAWYIGHGASEGIQDMINGFRNGWNHKN
ncbi:hypothetical protein [Companilactobacillus farciminis]|nr:hypothetical protein [Companilactobacillus farciminis]